MDGSVASIAIEPRRLCNLDVGLEMLHSDQLTSAQMSNDAYRHGVRSITSLLDAPNGPNLAFAVDRCTSIEVRIFVYDFETAELNKIGHFLTGRPPKMMGGFIIFDEIAQPIDPFQSKGLDKGLL